MEIIIIWIATIIASFCMEMYNELRMFKDVADAGYKVDINRIAELGKQLNPDGTKITLMSLLVIGVNMLMVFQRAIEYNNVRPYVLDQLNVIDALEEMSELEKQEYAKNPTSLNALMIIVKKNIEASNAITIKIKDGNEQSEIKFKMGSSLEDITIVSVTGPSARLSEEEQKKQVVETLKNAVKAGLDKFGDSKSFAKALCNNGVVDLNEHKEKENPLEKEPEEVIKEEQEFAIPVEEEKNAIVDEGPTLSKRIKY